MMPNSSFLTDWQHVLMLSQQMLIQARTQQWDALIDGELTYIQYVEALSVSGGDINHCPDPMQMREILRQLLDNEAEIKQLLLERMDELKVLIHQGNQQQSVNSTYGRLAGMLLLPTDNQDASSVTNSEL